MTYESDVATLDSKHEAPYTVGMMKETKVAYHYWLVSTSFRISYPPSNNNLNSEYQFYWRYVIQVNGRD